MASRRKPAPTAAGTVLPLSLVILCLEEMYYTFDEKERLETFRSVALVSRLFYGLARCCLYATLKLSLRDCEDQSLRTTRVMRTLLGKRSLAKHVTGLDLDTLASRPIGRSVMVSLLFDMKHLQKLELTYDRGAKDILAAIATGPPRTELVTLRLTGAIDFVVCVALLTLRDLTRLDIDAKLPDHLSPPVMALKTLSIRRECADSSFYGLTLFSTCSLTTLTITSSDKYAPPHLSYLHHLRQLQIMQPYRDNDSADRRLDNAAHAPYIEDLLLSIKVLFDLRIVAFINHEEMPEAPWPDLRQSCGRILKLLPFALVSLSLTAVTSSVDLNALIAFAKTTKRWAPYLTSIALHEEGKALLPAGVRVEEFEALLEKNGVKVRMEGMSSTPSLCLNDILSRASL